MTTANNEQKSQGPLRVGLIADGERLTALAAAIDACLLIQPFGQAGMPQAAAVRDVPWFDDPRVLLAQPGLEAVMLALSTRVHVELATMAAARGLHVWHPPPLARNFAEATEVVARNKRATNIQRVASWWEYVADQVWHQLRWPTDFKPLFSEIRVSARGPVLATSRISAADTGGGVLASDVYPLLEALVAVRGLPESASGAVGTYRKNAEGQTRPTEDTVVALLRYTGGGIGVIRATWDLPPLERQIIHYGQSVRVTLTDESASLADDEGVEIDQHPLPGDFLAHELMHFAALVRGQARDRAAAALEQHLAVSALLETIYLSARTGHPESPGKFYQVQGWPEPRS